MDGLYSPNETTGRDLLAHNPDSAAETQNIKMYYMVVQNPVSMPVLLQKKVSTEVLCSCGKFQELGRLPNAKTCALYYLLPHIELNNISEFK
jgi:hypothetical protein